MSAVEHAAGRIVVVPALVVDRDPHFGRIAVVQAVGTAVVLVPPKVLRVVDVRVVVEAVPILRAEGLAPRPPVGLLGVGGVGFGRTGGKRPSATDRQKDPADHRDSPLWNCHLNEGKLQRPKVGAGG